MEQRDTFCMGPGCQSPLGKQALNSRFSQETPWKDLLCIECNYDQQEELGAGFTKVCRNYTVADRILHLMTLWEKKNKTKAKTPPP